MSILDTMEFLEEIDLKNTRKCCKIITNWQMITRLPAENDLDKLNTHSEKISTTTTSGGGILTKKYKNSEWANSAFALTFR